MNKLNNTLYAICFFVGMGFRAVRRVFEKLIGKDCVAFSQMLLFIYCVLTLLYLYIIDHDGFDLFVAGWLTADLYLYYRRFKKYVEENGYDNNDVSVLPIWAGQTVFMVIFTGVFLWVLIPVVIIEHDLESLVMFVRWEFIGMCFLSFLNFRGPTKTVWADVKQKLKEKTSVRVANPARVSS